MEEEGVEEEGVEEGVEGEVVIEIKSLMKMLWLKELSEVGLVEVELGEVEKELVLLVLHILVLE